MNNRQLIVSSSPHVRDDTSVSKIMWSVVIALLPALFASIYFFGVRALLITVVSVIGAVVTEYIFLRFRGKKISIDDGSAVITGILLALTLPASIPYWMVFLGSIVAIALGKQIFGGLGHNPFNPALVGRAFLVAAYPVSMTEWIAPVDGVSTATPLNLIGQGVMTEYWDLFIGRVAGSMGETSAFALILGAIYLIYKGYISWQIPAGMLGTVFILTFIAGEDPIFHLLAGGLLIGALFMATDMVTSPVTKRGRWIFGIGAGVLVVIIRL